MGKSASKVTGVLSRVVKGVMVAVVIPLAVGVLQGILQQLEAVTATGGTFRQWIGWGFVSYLGIHLLLYRPATLFRASHRMFSVIAVWLFGGQVASVRTDGEGKGKGGKAGKGDATQGSTLVAFSPYVIPLPAILVCAAAWLLGKWVDRVFVDGPMGWLLGLAAAFHWLMTAEELQQQRDRWHLETYLLAIGLVFVLTLILGGACLPWLIPEFSFIRALADGCSQAQALYAMVIERLFL